jgi:UDP-N-acetylmuramoyl-L-alanyl-D-glutamate--2,6-diaminopimelate ligase
VSRPLSSLLGELTGAELVRGDGSMAVEGVQHDSRLAARGDLFVAIPGFRVDAHRFISEAAGRGAVAAIVQRDHAAEWRGVAEGLAVIAVDDSRIALAEAAAWFYRHPGRELAVIGITGTDGKTTTSYLVTSVLEAAGARVGRLGTVDVQIAGETDPNLSRLTTPEANEVQRILRRMVEAGCEYAVVESTSHGLALHRLDQVEYDVALMTNVTGDHLDFHETFEAYREAKALLFEALDLSADKGFPKTAIVNADDSSAHFMLARTNAEPLQYGMESHEAEVLARNVHLRADGSDFRLITPYGSVEASIRLPALFNVSNALAAACAGLAAGIDLQTIVQGLAACPGVPGRMERVHAGQPFEVIVDYAHTGESVRKVLEVLRDVCRGRLIIVVGAAGDRDPGRRFGVARAAANGADFAVFTSEDPRNEDPAAIVREIGKHAESAGRTPGEDFLEVEDRREAIREAFRRAQPGDLVLICGKGHEQSIIYGDEPRPWDDRKVAREELAALGLTAR